jgi:hypothetical protein
MFGVLPLRNPSSKGSKLEKIAKEERELLTTDEGRISRKRKEKNFIQQSEIVDWAGS